MTPQAFLEIELHLLNGRTHHFVQDEPALAEQILQQVGPKVFTRPSLVVTGRGRSAAYAGESLIGISLLMETVPQDLLHRSPLPTLPQEITQDDYQARQQGTSIVVGQPLVFIIEIEFASGHRLWLETQAPPDVSGMAERHVLHNIFSMPGLMCRRLGGGVSLWNGAQMVSCAFTPELEAPTNAWSAEFAR